MNIRNKQKKERKYPFAKLEELKDLKKKEN